MWYVQSSVKVHVRALTTMSRHSCATMTIRWKSAGLGQEPEQVIGIIYTTVAVPQMVDPDSVLGVHFWCMGIFRPSNGTA